MGTNEETTTEDSDYEYEDPLTAESLTETARKYFEDITTEQEAEHENVSSLADPTDDDTDEDDDDSDASSPLESSSSSNPEDENFITLGDRKIAKDEVLALANFQQFLKSRPDIQRGLHDLMQGRANLVPKNEANYQDVPKQDFAKSRVPEDLDLDDPSIKAVWEEAQALRSVVAELRNQVGTHNEIISTQQQQNSKAFLVQAETDFAKEHDLNTDDLVKIKEVAGRLGILPNLLSPIDPLTGLPREVNPLAAIKQTFATAYSMMPEFETKRQSKIAQAQQADRQRKKKLSSLSGTSGSVPRSTTRKEPTNAQERRQAMIQDVAQSMFGNGKE